MTVSISTLDFVFGSVFPHRNTIALKVIVNERWRGFGKYLNSGFDRSSFLKTDNSNEFSSSCTTRIVPILTTGVSFLRSYKVSNKRPIMGYPRSDPDHPRPILDHPETDPDRPETDPDHPETVLGRLTLSWDSPSLTWDGP